MRVPLSRTASAVLNLNKSNTTLGETPRRQQLRAEFAAVRQIQSVECFCFRSLLGKIQHIGHGELHPGGEFVGRDARGERRVVGIFHTTEEVELFGQVTSDRLRVR